MTKKSIFSQLFSFTVLIILCCLLFLGTLMFSLVGNYLSVRQSEELTYIADNLAGFTIKMASRDPDYAKENYQMNVDVLSLSSDTHIAVLNKSGETIAATSSHSPVSIKKEFYSPVMQGRRVRYTGTLGGAFRAATLTVGVPIVYGDSTVIGGVFVSMSVPEIQQMRSGVLRIFLLSVVPILIIAVIVIYIMSVRITTPLTQLKNAARAIADGHLEKRVNLRANNEIEELGDSFNKMADSLEQLENMRRSFIANVSHDLRTPMTTISGFVEGILDGTIPPEKQEQYLTIVLDETKRLSRLVTDLLDISKLEEDGSSLELREFDINEMIRLSVIKLENRITEKRIQLSIQFDSDSQRVFADKDSIQRVLTNLLDNAIKFTDEQGFIDLHTGIGEKGKVFISIQNSGMGIEKKELNHVFDRFYKTDKSRSKDKNGTGLGLYIVKNILKSHGETIWVESKPKEFARFTFTLSPAEKKD